jgi:hypothetical protein
LRAAERLVNLINRSVQAATPKLAFTCLELRLLDPLVKDEKHTRSRPRSLPACHLVTIWPVPMTLVQAAWGCGEAYPASPISNSVS